MLDGRKLAQKISDLLTITENEFRDIGLDNAIKKAFEHYVSEYDLGDMQAYHAACNQIVAGMLTAKSIDEYIDRRNDKLIEQCSKVAIVHSILNQEKSNDFRYEKGVVNDTINFKNVSKTWFPEFMSLVTQNCRKRDLKERFKQIKFIVFNYDRCVELYLLHSLKNDYVIGEGEAAEILESLDIIHPYGVVGALPWRGEGKVVGFGEINLDDRLPELAEGIQTFTEQATDTEQTAAIHLAMKEANLILFLGFAYHRQNLDLLKPGKSDRSTRIIGTAKGISYTDNFLLRRRLEKLFCGSRKDAVELLSREMTCHDLFTENWHLLNT